MRIDEGRNPRAALDAAFPQPIDCGEGVVVQPFSLAVYAMLERLGSYVVFPHRPTQEEVLKTLYVCTHDPAETYRDFDRVGELAFAWASGIRPYMAGRITEAVLKQIDVVKAALPPGDKQTKKAETAG